jgi:CHAT domain-containing protein
MVGTARFLAATTLVLLLAGAGARADTPAATAGDASAASCRSVARNDIAPDPNAPKPVYVLCGTGARPVGAVAAVIMPLKLPNEAEARHQAIEKAASLAPAGRDASTRMICKPGSWTKTPDGVEMLIRACALLDGEWPQVLVIASVGPYLIQAEGLPSLFPVIETTMASQAGYSAPGGAPAFGGPEAARKMIDAAFGGKVQAIGSADFDRYANLVETARLYNSRKNFRAAEDNYRQALDIQERAFGPNTIGVATSLLNLALEVSNQGRFEEAAGLFRRADPIVEASDNPVYRARQLEYQGFDAANAGKFADALRYGRAAAVMWRDMVSSNTPDIEQLSGGEEARQALRGELAHTLNLNAAMALRTGELAYAEAAAREALGIIGEQPEVPPWWGPEVLGTLGEIFAAEGRLREAEESLRGALIFQQRLFGSSAPTALTLFTVGKVYTADKLYDEAVRAYDYGLKILQQDEVARSLIGFDQLAPLIVAANALMNQRPADRAALQATVFRAMQLTSVGVADQTIERASARLAAGDPAIERLVHDLQEAERRRDLARLSLAFESSLSQDQRSGDKETALLQEVNTQSAKRDALAQQIQKDFPAYNGLANPSAVELPDLQKRLRPGEALVLFETGRDNAAAILVTADKFVARPLAANQAKLDTAVRDLRRALDARGGRIEEFDMTEAYQLYRTLFGPIEGGLAGVKDLIVVPSGALASLPAALLVTDRPAAGAKDYRHGAWLVQRYASSEAPSVRAFVTLRDAPANDRATRPFLGIGNPDFRGGGASGSGLAALSTTCRGDGPIPPQLLRALAPLPETAGEVRAVAQSLGGGNDAILLGDGATEAAFRKEPLDQFRVIYFATHGLLPGELSCETQPAMALSPPSSPAATKADDGLLEASEIAALQLNADLVVLSACNTAATGTQFGGDALSGVAQAFFYAGARTLVASHWQVPSSATVALMTGMFGRLGGHGTAEALRGSQLALIDQPATANPFFWGAFTVIGDGDRVAFGPAKARQSSLSSHEAQQ